MKCKVLLSFACLTAVFTFDIVHAQKGRRTPSFTEDFNGPGLKFFKYDFKETGETVGYKLGDKSDIEPNTKVLILTIDSSQKAGPGHGPTIVSKSFTGFGRYSARIRIPDTRTIQPDIGAVVGYFTYHMDSLSGSSEIDIEFLVADPTIVYIGTWTGFNGKLQRVGRAINLAKGIIYSTASKVNVEGIPVELTGMQNLPASLPGITGFDASARFYTYGFDWYPDRLVWWIVDPLTNKKIILWDYRGSALGIPTHPSEYRLNFWHTDAWAVETNSRALEKPRQPCKLEVDWMKYEPFKRYWISTDHHITRK